jgi:hypothetical protein
MNHPAALIAKIPIAGNQNHQNLQLSVNVAEEFHKSNAMLGWTNYFSPVVPSLSKVTRASKATVTREHEA